MQFFLLASTVSFSADYETLRAGRVGVDRVRTGRACLSCVRLSHTRSRCR